MPCYRCGARQTDPARGASPWQRAVRHDALVLVCPDCQESIDWRADLDHCAGCGSTALGCRLGEIECRECGLSRTAGRPTGEPSITQVPGLSQEVQAALDRVLGGHRTSVSH